MANGKGPAYAKGSRAEISENPGGRPGCLGTLEQTVEEHNPWCPAAAGCKLNAVSPEGEVQQEPLLDVWDIVSIRRK